MDFVSVISATAEESEALLLSNLYEMLPSVTFFRRSNPRSLSRLPSGKARAR